MPSTPPPDDGAPFFDRDQARIVILHGVAEFVRTTAATDALPDATGPFLDRVTELMLDRLADCVRPVAGVTLTLEETALVRSCVLGALTAEDVDPEAVPDLRALAARLEASRG